MLKQRAFVKYTLTGKLIEGSLVVTNGGYPKQKAIWKEVPADLCCDNNPTPPTPSQEKKEMWLIFDDSQPITNVIPDPSSVEDWNTFFELPANGSPFTSVVYEVSPPEFPGGAIAKLYGGSNIKLLNFLFEDLTSTIQHVIDYGSVIEIGEYSFEACNRLETVKFLNCKEIKEGGFYGCESLYSVYMPKTYIIAEFSFYICYSIQSMYLDYDNIITINAFSFYANESITNWNFPNATSIGYSAFVGCDSSKYFSFPKALTVDGEAFSACVNAESFYMPLVQYINIGAFMGCESLRNISFPSATYIAGSAFRQCKSLYNVSLPLATFIGDSAFKDSFKNPPDGGVSYNMYLDLDSVLALGSGPCSADTAVFENIIGKSIFITVPLAITTCNAGGPEADLQYLIDNNPVVNISFS